MSIQFYRKPGDKTLYEVGTNRPISATEFGIGTSHAGRGFQEVQGHQAPSQPAGQGVDFYRKPLDNTLYESGTNRAISATEFGIGTPNAGRGFREVPGQGQQSPIRRDGAGFEVIAESPMEAWQNSTQFIEAAKEIIRKKQMIQEPLTEQKAYWRQLMGDTTPFGGRVEQADEIPGRFTNEALRELSPSDQASIRSARFSAAQSHLQGISEEEKYRQTREEDVISSLTNLLNEKRALEESKKRDKREELELQKLRLQITEAADDLNLNVDDNGDFSKDFSRATVDDIAAAIRQIESGNNYEAAGASKEFGAYQFMPGTWNSWSSEYASKVLKQSIWRLEPTKENQDAVAKFKIQQYLDKGWTPTQVAAAWNGGEGVVAGDAWKKIASKGMGGTLPPNKFGVEFSIPNHVNKFSNALSVILAQKPDPKNHITWKETDTRLRELAKETGETTNYLWNNYADSDLDYLYNTMEDNIPKNAADKIDPRVLATLGINKNIVVDIIDLIYQDYTPDVIEKQLMHILKISSADAKRIYNGIQDELARPSN